MTGGKFAGRTGEVYEANRLLGQEWLVWVAGVDLAAGPEFCSAIEPKFLEVVE